MSQESANVLRVCGAPDRAEFVEDVMCAVFGDCALHIPVLFRRRGDGRVPLSTNRFDMPAAPPTGWVAELSAKMPDEEFYLISQWPKGTGNCTGESFTGGVLRQLDLRQFDIERAAVTQQSAATATCVKFGMPQDGPLPLAAIAEHHLRQGYVEHFYQAGGLSFGRRDIDELERHWRLSDQLQSLLSEQEQKILSLLVERMNNEAARLRAGMKITGDLHAAAGALAESRVGKLMVDSERAVLEQLSAMCTRLWEANFKPPVNSGLGPIFYSSELDACE